MKKSIYSIIVAGFLLGACSDEMSLENTINPEGSLKITMTLPEPVKVQTRDTKDASDAEKKINDVTVFIFNSGGTSLLQKIEVTPAQLSGTGDTKTVTVPFKDSNTEATPMVFVAVNCKNLLTGTYTSIAGLEEVAKSLNSDGKVEDSATDFNFIMGGKAKASSNQVAVDIKRTVSKMTLQTEGVSNFVLTGFEIRNAANSGSLGASTNDTYKFNTVTTNKTMKASPDASGLVYTSYLYPSKAQNSVTSSTDAYIIVSGKYDGSENDSYYRIELKNGTTKYDFEPNYWYEGKITSVIREGYPTANDAARHPDDESMHYEIHDHAANVYSMATDGQRELGVTSLVVFNSGIDNYLTVKRFSMVSGEEATEPKIEVLEGDDWLEVASVGEDDTEVSGSHSKDSDNAGTVKKYKLSLLSDNASSKLGDLSATIKITWMGLSREAVVTYDSEFRPEELFTESKLVMTGTLPSTTGTTTSYISKTYTIGDYWNFIKQSGTLRSESYDNKGNSPKLYGVATQDMGSRRIRNRGLHFPVHYGNDDNHLWKYMYYLTLDASQFGGNIGAISYRISGASWLRNAVKVAGGATNQVVITLDDSGNEYSYATGTLTLIVKHGDEEAELPFAIYHTGFFHWDNANSTYRSYQSGEDKQKAYYYYEVISIQGRHWLDRNLGATASGLYVEDTGGNSILGDDSWPLRNGSRGGYYIAAEEVATFSGNEKTTFEDPKFITVQEAICPPGYRVPSKQEWDEVRLSSGMKAEQLTSPAGIPYFSSYYKSETSGVGNIYFPKSRYLSGNQKMGDSSSGYYWTQTPSSGLEKNEIGRWLKVLNMLGSSTTYINGYVKPLTNSGDAAYMSLRLISNEKEAVTNVNTFGFKVKGATHVYVYSYDSGTKVGVFSWPGKAITTASGTNQEMYFTYNTILNVEDLYVIFTFVDDNGRIYTFDTNNDTDTELKDAKGWKVVNNGTYSFTLDPSSGTFTRTIPTGAVPDTN